MRRAWLAAALCCALPSAAVTAQQRQVVIYRCTDASGQVTVQNDVACPPGTRQRKQVIDVPPPLPSYQPRDVRMPAVVAEERAQADAAIAAALPPPVPAAARQPPPPLFQCSTWDQQQYLTEEATPQERCAPLQVVGLDGVSPQGAARACQTVVDACQPVAAEALCQAWQRRVDEAEFRWKFAGAGAGDARRLEYEQLAATLANSACP
ncbi:hypothetical protein [Cognatiluteimonas weifangensis]|uniref:DUF4124 domain-containing protein n=1 Tax=Cognatiluteimonas weifangensis TaxID=2303539 RepID=A0A372DPQ9_9GAMM|nr:hypothetical protein [Luteimonas weifangensis]RFP61546.1 hypothetical protein D0Y53_04330 [Luteimonas weifangensis]